MMQLTPPPDAQLAQFLFGWPKNPWDPEQPQSDEAYSSGAPKMCPVSWANTRSMLSGPQLPLSRCMTTRGRPA